MLLIKKIVYLHFYKSKSINLVVKGLKGLKWKMLEGKSNVDFTTNLDQLNKKTG